DHFNAELCKISIDANIYFINQYIANYPLEYQEALIHYLQMVLGFLVEQGNINKHSHPDANYYWKQQISSLNAKQN
ncbi:MAG: hypothetical protein KC505_11365, partial [Myxococcales bacterium]|nr:hypothetical protein [Myxococcales bacterium]